MHHGSKIECVFSMLQTVSEWLWWERLWLPANVSWSDLADNEGRVYAKASQLYAALPCALCLLLFRFLFERWEYTVQYVSNCVYVSISLAMQSSGFRIPGLSCISCLSNVIELWRTGPLLVCLEGISRAVLCQIFVTLAFTVMLPVCCCRYLATPLANVWGIRDRVHLTAEPNPILEDYFCSQTRLPTEVC